MRRKDGSFTAKFEEWCIKNPDECYGEMNYMHNEDDIRKSMKRYVLRRSVECDITESSYCILLGFALFVNNMYNYLDILISSAFVYNEWIFLLFAFLGIIVMLMPLSDIKIRRKQVEALVSMEKILGNENTSCGCRFYNNRVEFISGERHMVYNNDNIKKIYESADGLYFFLYSGRFEYIPSRFFDRDFAYMVTERLKVAFFEKYKRNAYMQVPLTASPAAEHESPLIEESNLSYEYNYVLDRKFVNKALNCSKISKSQIFQVSILILFIVAMIHIIFFKDGSNPINWLVFIFNIFYLIMTIVRRIVEIYRQCSKYADEYTVRFFYGHLSVIRKYSVEKIAYDNIYRIHKKEDCMILETYNSFDESKIIIPYYAVENVFSFKIFVSIFLEKFAGLIEKTE